MSEELKNEQVVETPAEQAAQQVADEVVAEDSWQPEYKFNVMDKEYEIPEYIRPVISKDNYNEVKDIFTKAYGLDHAKARAERLEAEYKRLQPLEQTAYQQSQTLGYLGNLVKNKDYNTLFKQLDINDADITNYTIERLKYQDLPPEQRREYDKTIDDRQRLYQLEQQNYELQQHMQATTTQERARSLDNLLGGSAKEVAEEFDSRMGQGAFRNEVIRRGQMAWYTQGRDISAEEAVNEAIRVCGINRQSNVGQNGGGNYQSAPSKPVIPNLRGGNQSPVRTGISSIDQLKKLAAQRSGV